MGVAGETWYTLLRAVGARGDKAAQHRVHHALARARRRCGCVHAMPCAAGAPSDIDLCAVTRSAAAAGQLRQRRFRAAPARAQKPIKRKVPSRCGKKSVGSFSRGLSATSGPACIAHSCKRGRGGGEYRRLVRGASAALDWECCVSFHAPKRMPSTVGIRESRAAPGVAGALRSRCQHAFPRHAQAVIGQP